MTLPLFETRPDAQGKHSAIGTDIDNSVTRRNDDRRQKLCGEVVPTSKKECEPVCLPGQIEVHQIAVWASVRPPQAILRNVPLFRLEFGAETAVPASLDGAVSDVLGRAAPPIFPAGLRT